MPRHAKVIDDPHLLEAALEGLQLQKQRIEAQIQEVRALLGQRRNTGDATPSVLNGEPKKRELSEAARRRIAAAQKKRWAEYRKAGARNQAKTE